VFVRREPPVPLCRREAPPVVGPLVSSRSSGGAWSFGRRPRVGTIAACSRAQGVFQPEHSRECTFSPLRQRPPGHSFFKNLAIREVSAYFRDGSNWVFYEPRTLRRAWTMFWSTKTAFALAEAAQRQVRQFTFESLWRKPSAVCTGNGRELGGTITTSGVAKDGIRALT